VAQAGQVRRRQQRLDVPAVQAALCYRQGADADALRGGGEDRHRAAVVRAHVLVLEVPGHPAPFAVDVHSRYPLRLVQALTHRRQCRTEARLPLARREQAASSARQGELYVPWKCQGDRGQSRQKTS